MLRQLGALGGGGRLPDRNRQNVSAGDGRFGGGPGPKDKGVPETASLFRRATDEHVRLF